MENSEIVCGLFVDQRLATTNQDAMSIREMSITSANLSVSNTRVEKLAKDIIGLSDEHFALLQELLGVAGLQLQEVTLYSSY